MFLAMDQWGDALFELADAMLSSPRRVDSVPSLSLEPVFRRSHGSLYKALARGNVDVESLRDAVVEHRPKEWPNVFVVDATTWPRRHAETSPERGLYYSASQHSSGTPVVAGWSYQWMCQVGFEHDSWTAPLDVERFAPLSDATAQTVTQVNALLARIGDDNEVPLFVFDAGYDPIALGQGLNDARCEVLVRLRSNRVFYPDPEPKAPRATGRPRRHGARFCLAEPQTFPKPDATFTDTDPRYGTISVSAFHGMHPRLAQRGRWTDVVAPIVRGSILRIEAEHLPKHSAAVKKTLWLWWSGTGTPDLERCARSYLRRFDIEHTFRFIKQTLGWATPSLQTPAQADRWTWLVLSAYTELRLARDLVVDLRLPWERTVERRSLTPGRVRRGFRQLHAIIGTPTSPPKATSPGPGRPKGTQRPRRTRHPVVMKAA
jgi:hypothetical protein